MNKYLDEIQELEAIAAVKSQNVSYRFWTKTVIGDIVVRNFDFVSSKGIDPFIIISAIIQILEIIGLKGRWSTFFKVGKIIFAAAKKLRSKRKFNWCDRINAYFIVQEFVDEKYYNKFGCEKSKKIISPKIINIATYIREKTGRAIMANTWVWGGRLSQRGYRAIWSRVGSKGSAHRDGDALDFNVVGWSTNKVHTFIDENKEELFKLGLRRVEKKEYTTGWTHIDTEETGKNYIYYFAP